MNQLIISFVAALIFGLGLGLSGMTLPSKVLGFLDVAGNWDPSLMAVMAGAILVHAVSYRLIIKRPSPVLAGSFQVPTRRDIDWKLVVGAAIFGLGWGLGGICPGPALVDLMTFKTPILFFVGSMILGMALFQVINKKWK